MNFENRIPTNGTRILQRVGAGLARPHTYGFFHIEDEDLAVPKLARVGRFPYLGYHGISLVVRDHNLNFNFWNEINNLFATAVNFLVSLLATVALDLGDGHALDADLVEGFFDIVQLEGLNNGFNFFHADSSC